MRKILLMTVFTAIAVCFATSCKKSDLAEENRSKLTTDFFSTAAGIDNGLNASYQFLRSLYGPEEGLEAFTNIGADEMRLANGNRTTHVSIYDTQFDSNNEFSSGIWAACYRSINTCNGLITFGQTVTGLTDDARKEKIAEAKFLRAFNYFVLVRLFGGVTITEYTTIPTNSATRAPLADCYNLIISDLKTAVTDLNPTITQPGRASIGAAKHLLALVYLTRGWSAAAQTTDFQSAYDTATDLINNAGTYNAGLLPDFADVFKDNNENNKEVLFNVQYSTDLTYGGGNNAWNHLYVNTYDAILGQRDLVNGRSYAWFRATNWVYNTAFADKTNDSRYYKTFQSVWKASKAISGTYTITVGGTAYTLPYSANVGDTALMYPGVNMSIDEIKKHKYVIYTPETYNDNRIFPTMTKYLDPLNRTTPNENSHRPVIVLRLAETYLVAAEAAFKLGQAANAATMINAIRSRAAYAGHSNQMQVTAADINLDFLLAERTREMMSENVRWFDLVRTGTLINRVRTYDDYQAKLNIQDFDILRPIPLSQINSVISGPAYPQNPGWH
jgi:hypothetical protein